jgi:hypothetical protein
MNRAGVMHDGGMVLHHPKYLSSTGLERWRVAHVSNAALRALEPGHNLEVVRRRLRFRSAQATFTCCGTREGVLVFGTRENCGFRSFRDCIPEYLGGDDARWQPIKPISFA